LLLPGIHRRVSSEFVVYIPISIIHCRALDARRVERSAGEAGIGLAEVYIP